MTVDNDDLREILRLFPLYQIRMIVDERDTGVKSRNPEELIDALVEEQWTEGEYKELINRLQTIQEEGRPLGYYICQIEDSPAIDSLEQELLIDGAKFDEEGHIEEEGYEIHHTSDSMIEGTRWRIDVEREFNFRTGEVERNEKTKPVDFEVNLNEMRAFIDTNQYGKAMSVKSKLEELGVDFIDIGHRNLNSEDANEEVKGFVEMLDDKLN